MIPKTLLLSNHYNSINHIMGIKHQVIKSAWTKIQNRLLQKNANIINALVRDGKLDLQQVQSYPWEIEFKPLYQSDLDSSITSDDLFHLADRGWITAADITCSMPDAIYPFALQYLVHHHLGDRVFNEQSKSWIKKLVSLTLVKNINAIQ